MGMPADRPLATPVVGLGGSQKRSRHEWKQGTTGRHVPCRPEERNPRMSKRNIFPSSDKESQFSFCRTLQLNPIQPVETVRSEGSNYKDTWAPTRLTAASVWVDS